MHDTMKKEFKDFILTWTDTPKAREKCWQTCLDWFMANQMFAAEAISQSDEGQINSVDLTCALADEVFKFEGRDK